MPFFARVHFYTEDQFQQPIFVLGQLDVLYTKTMRLKILSFDTFLDYMQFIGLAHVHGWHTVRLY